MGYKKHHLVNLSEVSAMLSNVEGTEMRGTGRCSLCPPMAMQATGRTCALREASLSSAMSLGDAQSMIKNGKSPHRTALDKDFTSRSLKMSIAEKHGIRRGRIPSGPWQVQGLLPDPVTPPTHRPVASAMTQRCDTLEGWGVQSIAVKEKVIAS